MAMAFKWEEILPSPKCDKKEEPQLWDTSSPHLITLHQRKTLKYEGSDYPQRPTTTGQ